MFKKLKEVSEGRTDLLTVRSTNVWLSRRPESTIHIRIDEEMEALTTSKERGQHFKTASPWLRDQIGRWRGSDIAEIEVASKKYPLEVIAGDIALILVIEGEKYLVSFFRDIDPVGWLVAGGCPRSRKEFFTIKELAIREASEEILISDKEKRAYQLFPSREEMEDNIQALKLDIKEVIRLPARELAPPKGDAQDLIIVFEGREIKTEGVNVTVDHEVASVAVILYYEVELPIRLSELMIFDGERFPDKTPIHRPAQLTDKDGNQLAIFSRGHNILAAKSGKPKWISEGEERRAVLP